MDKHETTDDEALPSVADVAGKFDLTRGKSLQEHRDALWGTPTQPLERRIRALETALRALVEKDPTWGSDYGGTYCVYCNGSDIGGREGPPVAHEPDCAVVAARALLGEGGG